MIRVTLEASEMSLPTANLCLTNEVKCFADGETEICPSVETVDPENFDEHMS